MKLAYERRRGTRPWVWIRRLSESLPLSSASLVKQAARVGSELPLFADPILPEALAPLCERVVLRIAVS